MAHFTCVKSANTYAVSGIPDSAPNVATVFASRTQLYANGAQKQYVKATRIED